MALVVKDFIDAGVHYGHRASRWNPKMKPYIYGKRNLIHIIDLKETVRGLSARSSFSIGSPPRAVSYCSSVPSGKPPIQSSSSAIGRECLM